MKKRSISYPSKTLFETKSFMLGIYEGVGDQVALQYDDMPKYAGVSRRETPYFASTATQYGWAESVHGKGYKMNGEVCKILRKPQDGEEAEVLKKAFISPEIYKTIIQEWNGKQIQSVDALDIYLNRNFSFSDTGSVKCAVTFIENAKALGLIDDDNTFRIDAEITISSPEQKNKKPRTGKESGDKNGKKKPNNNNAEFVSKLVEPPQNGIKKIPVFIRSKELLVPILEDMTADDWDAFIKQLQYKKNG